MVPVFGLMAFVLSRVRTARGMAVAHEPMSDITAAPTTGVSGIKLPGLGDIGAFFKRGDLALAIGVLTIISVLILMTALFIHTPLEFSSFPTVLLIATMLRLALNLASTRLILAHGHEG